MFRILRTVVLLLFCCNCLFSQSLIEGQRALEAGRFSNAVQIFTQLAEQNDKFAQFLLGSMYEQGKGVAQDFSKAYFWLFLASRQDAQLLKYLGQIEDKISESVRKEIVLQCKKWLAERHLADTSEEKK